jgi:hypothetical protein
MKKPLHAWIIMLLFLITTKNYLSAQSTFIVAKQSDPSVTTHEITSGNVTLGITDKGGGMINKFTLPGFGDIMGDVADRYGRGGQTAIRSFAHSGKYNPTQAGLTDGAGTQCPITQSTGKLVVDRRPCCLWRADGSYDYIEWEDLCSDNYNDGGTSGHNSDVDGIDESNLTGTQATEITSEFDFYCTYEDYMDTNGVNIPCFYHYYEFVYARYPGHCIDQFGEGTSIYNSAAEIADITVEYPTGTHAGSDLDMNNLTHWTTLRIDNDLWEARYRHYINGDGEWITELRGTVAKSIDIHLDSTDAFPMLILSDYEDINQGPAIGVFQPNSEKVARQTVGGSYTDDRRFLAWMKDDAGSASGTQTKFGFGGRTYGLLNRNRTPGNEAETWRGEMYYLVGTPAEIFANVQKLNTPDTTASVPSAPTGISLSSGVTDCNAWVSVEWSPNDSLENVTLYEVWHSSTLAGTYELATTVTDTTFTDNSEKGFETEYFYKVKAINLAGASGFSAMDSVTTSVEPTECNTTSFFVFIEHNQSGLNLFASLSGDNRGVSAFTGNMEKWKKSDIDGTWFFLDHEVSGMRLYNVSGTSVGLGDTSQTGNAYQWKLVYALDDYSYLVNKQSEASTPNLFFNNDGTKELVLSTSTALAARWKLVDAGSNVASYSYIEHNQTDDNLYASNNGSSTGISSLTGDTEKWEKIDIDATWFVIRHKASSELLRSASGTTVDMNDAGSGDEFKWKMISSGNGYYLFENKRAGTGLYLFYNNNLTQELKLSTNPAVAAQWKFVDEGLKSARVAIESVTGISTTAIKVYPNPVENGYLFIDINGMSGEAGIKIFSIDGRLVLAKQVSLQSNQTVKLNTELITTGIYLLRVESNNSVAVQKIVIK